MAIDWSDNKLTKEIKDSLVQGSKVNFMWHMNDELEYRGRIEVDCHGRLFWVQESNYDGDILAHESMRYYNPLDSFRHFTKFEVLP